MEVFLGSTGLGSVCALRDSFSVVLFVVQSRLETGTVLRICWHLDMISLVQCVVIV